MATPAKWPRVYLPQLRRACPRCAKVRDRGEPMPDYCMFCLNKNWHLYPDDYPMFRAFQEELDALRKRRQFGLLKQAEPKRLNRVGERRGSHSGGIARLTPEQRREYELRLAAALQRARLKGKPIDGAHLQPYRMGVLNCVLWRSKVDGRGYRAMRRYRVLRGAISRFKKIKMLQRLGMLDEYGQVKNATTPAGAATAASSQRSRTAYTSLE